MQQIPLSTDPNQSFSARLDNTRFTVRLKEARGMMVADVTIDDTTILTATRVLAGEPIIPYGYLEQGNFMLLTDAGDFPDYSKFGVTQFLVYLSAAEISG